MKIVLVSRVEMQMVMAKMANPQSKMMEDFHAPHVWLHADDVIVMCEEDLVVMKYQCGATQEWNPNLAMMLAQAYGAHGAEWVWPREGTVAQSA